MIEAYKKKIQQINRILKTKPLKPLERGIFLRRKKRLTGAIQRHNQDTLKRKLRLEADRRIEQNSPGIVGESLSHSGGLRIPKQVGGVKVYEKKLPSTSIRQFHPNINTLDRKMRLRRAVKKYVSKI